METRLSIFGQTKEENNLTWNQQCVFTVLHTPVNINDRFLPPEKDLLNVDG